jgi:hypothetical protein
MSHCFCGQLDLDIYKVRKLSSLDQAVIDLVKNVSIW